jgi:VanZ family protein
MKIKKILNIILLIIVIFTIFMFSNQNSKDSGKISKDFGVQVVTTIDNITNTKIEGNKSKEQYVKKNLYFIRKFAHISEYIILSIVLLGLISYYKKIDIKWLIISIVICIIFASIDEFHQLFISGRTGKVIDVFIDTIGIIIGSLIYYIVYINGKGKKHIKKKD